MRYLKLCVLATVIFATSSIAQVFKQDATQISNVNNLFTFRVLVDSVGSTTTNSFTLAPYDAESFVTYPVSYGKMITSAGMPRVSVYVDGSYGFSTWATVDTLFTSDSLTTFASGTFDLSNKHFPYYRLRVIGTAGNRKDAVLNLVLYKPKKQ